MTNADPTPDEVRAAIATVRHCARVGGGTADALNALDIAAEDGVDVRQVAVTLATFVVALRQAAGLDVEQWASIAMPAVPDWTQQ